MNIRPYYVYQKGVFPADFCDRVIEEGEKLPHNPTGAVGMPTGKQANVALRSTELAFFPQKPAYAWLYENILRCINTANAAYWKFNLSAMEPAQYGIYNPGQFYSWHIDQHPRPYAEGPFKGLTRKLSFTLQLTDGEAYDGGDFEPGGSGPTRGP